MEYINGHLYAPEHTRCRDCNGSGEWYEEESGLDWLQGFCSVCDGTGIYEQYAGSCIYCDEWTCNRAFGDYVCTICDETRHEIEPNNYPELYDRRLL
jgi:hypothetical protein